MPPLGIALGLIGLVLLLVVIWSKPDTDSEILSRGLLTEITLALAATHASLVGIFGLGHRYALAAVAAYVLNALLTATTILWIWWEPDWDVGRWYGTLLVLLIATTIAIPVLRRLEGPSGNGRVCRVRRELRRAAHGTVAPSSGPQARAAPYRSRPSSLPTDARAVKEGVNRLACPFIERGTTFLSAA